MNPLEFGEGIQVIRLEGIENEIGKAVKSKKVVKDNYD